jgi:uncharacterized protein (DUF427 family)
MPKAILNGTVLAESDRCERVEGNYYFPPESVNKEYFQQSDTHTSCPWKGQASYYTINLDGEQVKDGAWYYPDAKERAKNIEGYVAFYKNKGITIEE